LNKEKSTPVSISQDGNNFDPVGHTVGSMPPYVLAKEFENSEHFAEMKRSAPAQARLFWTPSRVAALDTNAILRRLARFRIVTNLEDFRSFAETFTSAWSVSGVWRAKLGPDLSRHDDDFLGLAACELWKRYCPDVPSIEMLDDWMQEGYGFMMDGNAARACDLWSAVWEVIRLRLKPTMRTCDQASSIFDGTQCLFNWIQDYCLELSNAALDNPRYATDGIRLCEDVLAQFVDESHLFHRNFRTDLGQFHFLAGCPKDGEHVLLEVIRDYPNTAVGYARLADMLAYGVRPNDEPIDPQRAQKILEDALARPVKDAADYDLEIRLSELRDNLRKSSAEESA
jgi:hypothetical protein